LIGKDAEPDRPVEEIALELDAGLKCCQSVVKDFRARLAEKAQPEEKMVDALGLEPRTR
jgi:hypothetical protein